MAHSLAKRGIDVISCDCVGMTATSFSKFTSDNFVHTDPETDPDGFIADLLAKVKLYAPDDGRPYVLMPAFREAKLIAEHADQFAPHITLACADYTAMDKVNPKHHLMQTLSGLDITAPKQWHPTSETDVEAALKLCEMPALLKALDEVGGRGIDFFDDKSAMRETAFARLANESPPPLIQEAIDGEDYCMCVLCDSGKIVAHMAYKNLQNMPFDGGAGAMRQTVEDEKFLEPSQILMAELNWTGIAEIDFRWSGEAQDPAYLIEVNPRFWAGIYQSVASGIDFPWHLYELVAHGSVSPVGEADTEARTRMPLMWLAGAVRDAIDSDERQAKLDAAWSELGEGLASGDFSGAWTSFKTYIKGATDFDAAIQYIQQQRRSAKSAQSEVPFGEDPMTSLGVFFVLNHLVRHGSLPPEITR